MSIDQPSVTTQALAQQGTQPVLTPLGTARIRLAGRVLLAVDAKAAHTYPQLIHAHVVDPHDTGLIVPGRNLAAVRGLRTNHPTLFFMCDPPESGQFTASAATPFPTETDHQASLLPPLTLEQRIQQQIDAGASLAFTPTGYLLAGDHGALRAVITQANLLNRDDVVVLLPMDHTWLRPQGLKLLSAAITRCRHPVAVALGDVNGDPMSRKNVLAGARELCRLPTPPMFHRIDLAGYHLMARGAVAASVGVIASKRRAEIPGKPGYAPRANRGANVLLADLLRFRRSLDLQDEWYASRSAPTCPCSACHNQALDRFGSSDYDRADAAQHNAIGLLNYIDEAQTHGGYARYWPGKVRDALAAHATLGGYVGAPIAAPAEVKAWDVP